MLLQLAPAAASQDELYRNAKALAVQQEFRSFDGKLMRYYTHAHYPNLEGNAPAVILAHGFTGQAVSSWFFPKSLAPHLAKLGFRVYALDLRGHGNSARCTDPDDYKDDASSKDIAALASHLGLSRYHAVGKILGLMRLL